MNKHRICTTISEKHWELLKKFKAKYETQQKTIEFALENLVNDQKKSHAISHEEQIWQHVLQHNAICLMHKEVILELIRTADFEQIKKLMAAKKTAEHLLTLYYQKPLKKCSLMEVLDGVILLFKAENLTDSILYTDDGDFYTLKIVHSLNENSSRMFNVFVESMFEDYGLKTESEVSEKSLFMKIYKDQKIIVKNQA